MIEIGISERLPEELRGWVGMEAPGTVEGCLNRPPTAESADGPRLYETARALAARCGHDLPKQHLGGGSDGNSAAAIGIPALAGLSCTP